MLESVHILRDCNEIEISFIVNHLKTILFLPNDVIMRQGEEGDKLFFIDRGIVDIFINKYDFVNKQSND